MKTELSLSQETHIDGEVIQAVLLGHQDRFAELVERYQRTIYGIAWSRLRETDSAEDVVQETFLQAYRHLPSLRDPERFPGWLTRIARNLANRAARLSKREHVVRAADSAEQERMASVAQAEISDAPTPWDLSRALQEISPAYREALVLFYIEEKDIRECAELLGTSETSFKTRLHRARKSMKRHLEQSLEQELKQLGRRVNVTPAVMSGIGVMPLGVGGTGALSGLLIKASPVVFQLGAMFGLLAMVNKGLADNYRDDGQIRRQLLRRNLTMVATIVTVILVPIMIIGHYAGMRPVLAASGAMLALSSYPMIKAWRLSRSRHFGAIALGMWIMGLSYVAYGVFDVPLTTMMGSVLVLNVLLLLTKQDQPLRTDYSLFLRAGLGTLDVDENTKTAALSPQQMEDYSRLLASHHLIADRKQGAGSWELMLMPIMMTPQQFLTCFLPRW